MNDIAHTPAPAIAETVARLRASFDRGRTRPLAWRLAQLHGLQRFVRERAEEIHQAVHADLGKPRTESFIAEIGYLEGELEHSIKALAGWMKPDRVSTPIVAQPGRSRIYKDPLGVVLIIAPWNYPVQLAVAPLIGAIAAGNCAIVKPSEIAPHTSEMLAALLPQYLDAECVQIIEGGIPETTELLAERFDHIFYTGNGMVGRIVMTAAAKHLTPVTLELGGKSPCIIDRDVDLKVAARRIAWGKFYNAGQTCVAPDYVLAHRDVHERFLEQIRAQLVEFYGADPAQSPDFARIINQRHHDRLTAMLEGATAVAGGQHDRESRYIAPTVLRDVTPECPVMQSEIFGPILPVLPVDSIDDAISFVNRGDKPLALYVFSNDTSVQDAVLERTSSGGATVNHAWMHLGVPGLPFGGVGESGMGAYHGRASFDTFTHHKSVLRKPLAIDPPLIYPPYSQTKTKWIERLL